MKRESCKAKLDKVRTIALTEREHFSNFSSCESQWVNHILDQILLVVGRK